MARVYIDSGREDGFDAGAGANIQPNVTGRMTVTNLSTLDTRTIDTPLNPTGFVNAPLISDIDRNQLGHSLNFELPIELLPGVYDPPGRGLVHLSTNVRLEIEVESNGPAGLVYRATSSSIDFTVHNTTSISLVYIPCTDNNTNNSPGDAGWGTCVQGARTRYPIAHNRFISRTAPNHQTISTDENLTTDAGWEILLDRLEDIAGDYEDNGEIWCIIVPNDNSYANNGIAIAPSTTVIEATPVSPRIELRWTHPRLICREGLPASFAHELGHTQGIHHSDCGSPPGEIDTRLPNNGRINQTGVDVYTYQAMPRGNGELMSYCGGQNRWPSVEFWNIIFDRYD